jgi:hypothetical protein
MHTTLVSKRILIAGLVTVLCLTSGSIKAEDPKVFDPRVRCGDVVGDMQKVREYQNAKQNRIDAEEEYYYLLGRYERFQYSSEKRLLSVERQVAYIEGKLTGILLEMGIDVIAPLLDFALFDCQNNDENYPFKTYCEKAKKGAFFRRARRYAKYLGKRDGRILLLIGISKTQLLGANRLYDRLKAVHASFTGATNVYTREDQRFKELNSTVCQDFVGGTPGPFTAPYIPSKPELLVEDNCYTIPFIGGTFCKGSGFK